MTRLTSTLALLLALAAPALPAVVQAAGSGGCDQFLARSCSAAEQAAFDKGRANRSARDDRQPAARFDSCDAALGRACTAPEAAGFRAGARVAPDARTGAPSRCEDMLGRRCSAQEERGFAKGAGRRSALATR